jgi:NitT/TauT family transport system substrate-binding protein
MQPPAPHRLRRILSLLALVGLVAVAAACGGGDGATAAGDTGEVTLRLGMFPNVTHAPGLVGVEDGLFDEALDDRVELEVSYFNAGPEAVTALLSGALDISYIGPNPAINAFAQSNGDAVRIIAGATSGGAALVVKPDIDDVQDLTGRKVATPQLGNTQDVALRAHLRAKGLDTDASGGGDVSIVPQANADTLNAFKANQIAGAWLPEPWVTRLVQEGGGKVLVDEKDLWPGGDFVTTHVVVRTDFLEDHPDVVEQFLEGHLAALAAIDADGAAARASVNAQIAAVTQKPLPDQVIDAAWRNLRFTADPIASSLERSKDDAVEVGLLKEVDLDGIYALDLLNGLLVGAGEDEVEGL